MSLTKNEFKVLQALSNTGERLTQRTLADETGLSLGTVNSTVKACRGSGMLEDGRITEKGVDALEPYRVRNAVIMAAGLSSRFVPLSYERPKGMLRVKGEVLIERQIKQLLKRGISDITVVVGYKKEYFFYLAAKYGVKILVNDEYAEKNNSWTLWLARNQLDNTYVCSSDDYFTVNPFERYVYKSYYASEYVSGPTNEWCLGTGAGDRITSVSVGGHDSWVMLGQVYFDHEFSSRFVPLLGDALRRPGSSDKLWESIYADNLKTLDMEIRRYPEGVIHEFDSLAELESFDPEFISNVDSTIFDNIVGVLGCRREEVRDFYPLKQGITNLSCHFATDEGEWVYRHPGIGTELLVNRRAEVAALEVARSLGVDDTFVYEDPERGWKISRFVPDSRQPNPHDPSQAARIMQMARSVHRSGATVGSSFDFFEEAQRYASLLRRRGPIDIPGYEEMAEKVARLAGHVKDDGAPTCLCHNDFFTLNFLVDKDDKYYLIDWEYAGMGDYANDFGTFAVCDQLDEGEMRAALAAYFDREPTEAEWRHNLAHVVLAGWCWYLWALLKEAEGDNVGEWLYIYFNGASTYLDQALSLYEEA
ncbi:phosphotransferase [Olsenella profusa]|uniref:Phosphotransferase n=1 Tax=Olsenella profusa TaxID=138595 RepID=A0ABS2F1Y0_9ACTN|nr:phosphotransferase [Olsenella profusa]MBM6774817.1 phosphotransferase [Olsenella profusa]